MLSAILSIIGYVKGVTLLILPSVINSTLGATTAGLPVEKVPLVIKLSDGVGWAIVKL